MTDRLTPSATTSSAPRAPTSPPPHGPPRRRILGGAAALAILIPGARARRRACYSTEDVARSLPAGTQFLVGTTPKCDVRKEGVEYHCTIQAASSPRSTAR